jgi:hypothetical protein
MPTWDTGYDLPWFVGYMDLNREIILNSNFQRYKRDHNNLYSSAKNDLLLRLLVAWQLTNKTLVICSQDRCKWAGCGHTVQDGQ